MFLLFILLSESKDLEAISHHLTVPTILMVPIFDQSQVMCPEAVSWGSFSKFESLKHLDN